MRKFYIYVILLSVVFSCSSLFAVKKDKLNILYYYRMIPKRLFLGEKWKLVTEKDEKGVVSWGIRDPAYGNAFFPMVVDFKNGFIELEFSGAGYGRQQIVLFIAKSGKKYIGLSNFEHSGIFLEVSRLKFYRVDDLSWKDVSSEISPEIPYIKFLKSKKNVGKVEAVKRIISPLPLFSYSLPRWGVVMKIKLHVYNLKLLTRSKDKSVNDRRFTKMPASDLNILKNFIKQIKKNEIRLKWNRDKGLFFLL